MDVIGHAEHQKLKKVFLYSPFGDHDKELLKEMIIDTKLKEENVEHWFGVMRQRMNVDKFLKLKNINKIDDDVDTDSGKTPLESIVKQKSCVEDSSLEDSSYSLDDSFLEESMNASEIECKDSTAEQKQKKPSVVKTSSSIQVKEEKLSMEEKAKKYDQLKTEMSRLQEQMEEMKKKLETAQSTTTNSPTAATPGPTLSTAQVKQEPMTWPQQQPQQYPRAQWPPYQYQPYPGYSQPYILTYPQYPLQYQQQQQQYRPQQQQLVYPGTYQVVSNSGQNQVYGNIVLTHQHQQQSTAMIVKTEPVEAAPSLTK